MPAIQLTGRSLGAAVSTESTCMAGPYANRPGSRYRRWLTHKLGTWHAQFGESGCVGCGRCIAWCPVGIDVTEETAALAAESRGVS